MKKEYKKPSVEEFRFDAEDVIMDVNIGDDDDFDIKESVPDEW